MKSAPMFLLVYILLSYTSCTKTYNSARPASLPMLTTTPVNSISNDTAVSGGNIYSDGGLSIIERGIVWDTDSLPTIALSTKTLNGIDTGTFQSHLTGLNCFTKYNLRAYATNAIGTAYGNQITFTTSTSIGWEHLNIYKSVFFDSVIMHSSFGLYPNDFTFTNNLALPAGVLLYIQFDSVYCNLYASSYGRSSLIQNGDTLQLRNSAGIHHNSSDISSTSILGAYSIHISGRAVPSENNYYCKFRFINNNMANIRNVYYSFNNDAICNPTCPLQ